MLNEFYNYIANNTLGFFQKKGDGLQSGERYCLKLDTEEMVRGVDTALRNVTKQMVCKAVILMAMFIQHSL